MTTRRTFLKSVSLGMAALSSPLFTVSCLNRKKDRPNVILIITDDQGYGDFGVTGNPVIQTPNIDTMAGRSAQMSQFYVSPVCAPTRACLMTGRYNYRTRCIDTYIGRAMMEPEEVTVAEILRKAGYATGLFGKWHLGDNHPMRPQDQGFDEVLVHRGGGIGQPSDLPGGEGKYTDPILFHNGQEVQEKGYCTDVYFNRAMTWMEAVHKRGRNFFLYLPTNAPHGPFHDVIRELYEAYKTVNLNNDQFPQQEGHPLPKEADTDRRARIFSMISNIDDNVGGLLEKLDHLQIVENTLILFMVDNGPNGQRYVTGFRGSKGTIYEGGIRSPLFVRWPEKLKPGRSSDRVAAHIDILPTILDACDVPIPNHIQLDGRSLLPLLREEEVPWPDRHIVIQAHRGDVPVPYHNFAIRNQRWKLLNASGFHREIFEGEPSLELYDMEKDPFEIENLASHRPEVVQRLRSAYEEWFSDVSSTRSDNYAPPRIHIGSDHENPVVLTRQDWRHIKGRPWGADSNGYWMLYVVRPGRYDVRLRFRPDPSPGEVVLELGGKRCKKSFEKNQEEVLFKAISMDRGSVDLKATLKLSGKTRGPWQVEVIF